MTDSESYRYCVALPGGFAVLVFVWWLWREMRKSRTPHRGFNTHGPVHIVVIQDTTNSANGNTTGMAYPVHEAAFSAYEECRVGVVDEEPHSAYYHRQETLHASKHNDDITTQTAASIDRR